MREIIAYGIIISLLLVAAGCISNPSGNVTPGITTIPVTGTGLPVKMFGSLALPSNILPMDGYKVLGNATKPFNVSIDSIEMDAQEKPGEHSITIFIAAKNTGNESLALNWYSKLTDINGKSYGGIGFSHAGSGARTRDIPPNWTEMARDYVVVNSDTDFATLSQGAILEVYFLYTKAEGEPLVPDYKASWFIEPGVIG